MDASRKTLVVEGWRGINHSFALVNQFQLLELIRRQDTGLRHVDAPFHYAHWSRAINGAGFSAADEASLTAIPAWEGSGQADWQYRIFSPVDLRPPQYGRRLAVFAVTECGLDSKYFAPGSDVKSFEAQGSIVVTPSHWSRDRIIDFGFQPETVHVVPHAASAAYFQPLPTEVNTAQRSALGFGADEVLLLNIGAAIWNKGIDVLLKGFALARQQRKDLRLVFKDQRNTYGISGENFVQTTLAAAGLLSADVLGAITLIPANLAMAQMNSIYNVCDCYVSPYRAEGFNLPVYEAMACQTPVIVTEGGATDDFARGEGARTIRSTLHRNAVVQQREVSGYCEPDLDHLVELLLQTGQKSGHAAPVLLPTIHDWQAPVAQLLALMP
ncbi:glycosyltransferase family 4 protein [uncultured Rhodoferax sp.]|uniref:glycosyltransferase family 4 protein n=1 Tax=uncultured Rhodoferax sp. TaxID=223188 RepID=UPI0025D1575D|nr:glycosyltransferase family 4 protein [uncultured Rhodoferax sp.]